MPTVAKYRMGQLQVYGVDWLAFRLPGEIAPNDKGYTYLIADVDALDEAPLDPRLPVVGWVQLATGEKIRSKPRTLMAKS